MVEPELPLAAEPEEDQQRAEQLTLVGALEALADAALEGASLEVPAGRDCDFQQLADEVQAPSAVVAPAALVDSRAVERGSSADTAACGDRRDTAGIPAGTAACGRKERKELLAGLEGSPGRIRAAASASQPCPCPGDAKPSRSEEEWKLPGCAGSGQARSQSEGSASQLAELSALGQDAGVDLTGLLKLLVACAQQLEPPLGPALAEQR